MYEILLVVYLLVALALIGLVLIQQGKGASAGASFGGGASATVFGSSGSGNFLTRTTAVLAILFFAISLALGAMTNTKSKPADTWTDLSQPKAEKTVVKQEPTPAEITQKDKDVPN